MIVAATGCTRVVDLDLTEGPVRLVVEGRLERIKSDVLGHQSIRLSTTDAFAHAGLPPAAVGAKVTITDSSGRVETFSSLAPGLYETSAFFPVIGMRYTLDIEYQGEHYRATDRLLPVAPIDSLYFKFMEKAPGVEHAGLRAVVDYTDPPGLGNDYLWELVVDDSLRISPDPGNRFRIISEDRFYDGGRVVGYQPFDEEVVRPGQRVLMRQVGISEQAFRYYSAIFAQSNGTGSPFSVPPASVRGNVANVDDGTHYPLGYFLAAEVSEKLATVPAVTSAERR